MWSRGGSLFTGGGSSCSVHTVSTGPALEVTVLTPHHASSSTSPSGQRKGILLLQGEVASPMCLLVYWPHRGGGLLTIRQKGKSRPPRWTSLTSSLLECWAPCYCLMRLDVSTHTQPLLVGMEMELQFFCVFWFQCGNWLKVFCPARLPLSNFMQITTWHSGLFLLQD